MDRFIAMIGCGLVGLTLFIVFLTSSPTDAVPETTATAWAGDIQNLTYEYDASGNLTQILDTSITPTAKTMSYGYDSLHRLTGATSSGFVFGDYTQSYAYDPLGTRLTATTGTLTYLHQDHLGGIALATDTDGVITQLYDTHPYGTELLSEDYDASSSSTPYSFTGKEYTEDTGLFYFEARWYDPLIGRFVSGDPYQKNFLNLGKESTKNTPSK